ncbi:ABC transporter substrate-binding protein [Fredinandcohnia onubensis]|uniref:ABC transporter substrate-binding protein n=1 Tax=Fredinandcohnia onubensis TaxID=1571209 RepID=UPI000C0BEEEF|nr:sugar ABC transporter substrate-binding protein [Fredinandcohnia onubensis]
MKKSSILVISFILVLSLFLAACGGGDSVTSSSDKESESGKTTLTMIESLTSPERSKLLRGMLDEFEKLNPEIKVNLISPPLQNSDQKITQMMMAKEKLDVVEVRDYTVKQFSVNGFIEDLTPYIEKWSEWENLTENARYGAKFVDDTPYYLPYGFYQKSLYYRVDRFEELGLEVPKTWEELLEVGKALTDASENKYGYSFRGGAGSSDYFEFFIWSFLGDKLEQKDSYFAKNGNSIFGTAEAKEALQLFIDIYKKASPADAVSWSYPEMVQGFTSGVTGMLIQDPEVILTADENLPEGTWNTAPIPVGPSGEAPQAVGAAAGWGMTSYSENKEEAWKLIEFLSSPEQNLYFTKNNSLIPIFTSASEDPFFNEGYYKAYLTMNEQPEIYTVVDKPVAYEGYGQFRIDAEKDIQKLLLDQAKVEEVLEKWDSFWKSEKEKMK